MQNSFVRRLIGASNEAAICLNYYGLNICESDYCPRRVGPERLLPGRLLLERLPELRPPEKPPPPARLRKPFPLLPLYGLVPIFLAWVCADASPDFQVRGLQAHPVRAAGRPQ